MIPHAEVNKDFKYILTVIDCFSKYAWAIPLLRKTAQETADAMESIFESPEKRFLKPPKFLQVDRGSEFNFRIFQRMLKRFNVKMYSTHSNLKASICERFNRTLKNLKYREFSARGSYNWIDILDDLMKCYNTSIHRTIKCASSSIHLKDEGRIQAIHNTNHASRNQGTQKFQLGDIVRISGIKAEFTKGYYPNWSTELFKIIEICNTCPVTYKLEDYHGHPLLGGFYKEEISKTNYPDVYLVEKILERKKGKVLVKFLGFPDSENMWISMKNIV